MEYQKMEEYFMKNCKVNDELLALSVPKLISKFGTTRQNIHSKINKILEKNKKLKKVGEYILIKIKK